MSERRADVGTRFHGDFQGLEKVERRLQTTGVPGISVTHVKGFGEYANFFSREWMVRHARIEVFTTAEKADAIVTGILETACSGTPGDGLGGGPAGGGGLPRADTRPGQPR